MTTKNRGSELKKDLAAAEQVAGGMATLEPSDEIRNIEEFVDTLVSKPDPNTVELRLTDRASWYYHDPVGQNVRDRKVHWPLCLLHYQLPAVLAKLRGRITGAYICDVMPETNWPRLREAFAQLCGVNPMSDAGNPAYARLIATIEQVNEFLYARIRNSSTHARIYEQARQARFCAKQGIRTEEDAVVDDLPF